ncbi:alanine amino transferase8 [Zea mays]|uniref:Alanine amino transferase8 n=1 Tax=Zea mays TaxID=4577 RepID=A0A1D6FA23_MAIZE|nr:alanine amino transferase8 [Zea mays]
MSSYGLARRMCMRAETEDKREEEIREPHMARGANSDRHRSQPTTEAGGVRQGHLQQRRPHGRRGGGRGATDGGGEHEPAGGESEERRHHQVRAAERQELPRRREPRVLEERQVRAGHDPPAQERRERGDTAAAAVGELPSWSWSCCCNNQVT